MTEGARADEQGTLYGYHQNWYAVGLSDEVGPEQVMGTDFLGGRIVVYRTSDGVPIVTSGICPHMGLDLALGAVLGDQLRCGQHHFTFGPDGACTSIPDGDRIPSACRLLRYPTAERWGLIWAFNGEEPLFPMPDTIGPYGEEDLVIRARRRAVYHNAPWVVNSQLYDWSHLRHVHGLQFDAEPDLAFDDPFHNRYEMTATGEDGFRTTSKIDNYGTNLVTYLTEIAGMTDSVAIFTTTPTTSEMISQTYYCVGAPHYLPAEELDVHLTAAEAFADQIAEEDRIAVNAMRFREGTFVRADRTMVRYFNWAKRFPKANPGEVYQ